MEAVGRLKEKLMFMSKSTNLRHARLTRLKSFLGGRVQIVVPVKDKKKATESVGIREFSCGISFQPVAHVWRLFGEFAARHKSSAKEMQNMDIGQTFACFFNTLRNVTRVTRVTREKGLSQDV
eukprot:791580-Pelagomonas_calceolata.AAC.1